jgi:hypothetical protein
MDGTCYGKQGVVQLKAEFAPICGSCVEIQGTALPHLKPGIRIRPLPVWPWNWCLLALYTRPLPTRSIKPASLRQPGCSLL